MKKSFLPLFLLAVCAGLAGPAAAEKADRNKPMNIEADALRYDDVKQVSVFSGNVVLTKGTIVIRGAQVEVRQDPDGYQFGLVTGAADKQAYFRQKREGLDEVIEGQGDAIEYDGRADKVKFIKNAQLRRLRGATLADEITGGLIVYDNLTDMFSVDGSAGVNGKAAATAPGGRVRAMLTPKPDSAAASQANGPAAVLRGETSLGSTPK